MSEKNRFSKPVAFNNKNAIDKTILDHVKRRNFSGYVKKLILADIAANGKNEEQIVEQQPEPKPLTAAERLEQMKKSGAKRPAGPTIFNQLEN